MNNTKAGGYWQNTRVDQIPTSPYSCWSSTALIDDCLNILEVKYYIILTGEGALPITRISRTGNAKHLRRPSLFLAMTRLLQKQNNLRDIFELADSGFKWGRLDVVSPIIVAAQEKYRGSIEGERNTIATCTEEFVLIRDHIDPRRESKRSLTRHNEERKRLWALQQRRLSWGERTQSVVRGVYISIKRSPRHVNNDRRRTDRSSGNVWE